MAFGDTYESEKLLEDIEKLGLPEVIINHHGGTFKLIAEGVETNAMHIKLYSGDSFCNISIYDAYLLEKTRPDGSIAYCKRCYAVMKKVTDKCMFDVYWPEVRG